MYVRLIPSLCSFTFTMVRLLLSISFLKRSINVVETIRVIDQKNIKSGECEKRTRISHDFSTIQRDYATYLNLPPPPDTVVRAPDIKP